MTNMEAKSPVSVHDEQPSSEKSQSHDHHSHTVHGAALTGKAHLYQGTSICSRQLWTFR